MTSTEVLEQQLQEELIKNAKTAEEQGIYNPARYLQNIEKHGGFQTVKYHIGREMLSDGFLPLKKAGKLKLSLEATVVEMKYAELFSDDEVNYCFDVLCENGFYDIHEL